MIKLIKIRPVKSEYSAMFTKSLTEHGSDNLYNGNKMIQKSKSNRYHHIKRMDTKVIHDVMVITLGDNIVKKCAGDFKRGNEITDKFVYPQNVGQAR